MSTMKLRLLGALEIMATVSLFSQGYYPLQIGNMWQYRDSYDSTYGWTHTANKDTVLPNGHTYTMIMGDNPGSYFDGFYRQKESKVFYYGTYAINDTAEDLWYDYAKTTGDTLRVWVGSNPNGMNTITVTVIDDRMLDVFGKLRRTWTVYETSKNPGFYIVRMVADSIGLVYLAGEAGIAYTLRGAIINGTRYGTITDVESPHSALPNEFSLGQNYPNPFNPATTITFKLPREANVTLEVYDVLGREIRTLATGVLRPGAHNYTWDGKDAKGTQVPSGVYFYQLRTDGFIQTKAMMLLK
jgi:hypothetical protein